MTKKLVINFQFVYILCTAYDILRRENRTL